MDDMNRTERDLMEVEARIEHLEDTVFAVEFMEGSSGHQLDGLPERLKRDQQDWDELQKLRRRRDMLRQLL